MSKSLRQIAKEMEISPSYLSMILSGQRKCPPEFIEKLQSIPDVHKIVNNQLQCLFYTQEVRGPNPLLPTTQIDNFTLKNSQKFTTEHLEKFIDSRIDDISKRTIEYNNHTFTRFIGYPLSPDGAISFLKSKYG